MFKPRLSVVDMVTWWPLATIVLARFGWFPWIVTLIVTAGIVGAIEERVLGKGKANGDGR